MADRGSVVQRALHGLKTFGAVCQGLYRIPGRIEVLGKHTDYAGGRSLVCATEQGIAMATSPRSDSTVRLVDVASGEQRAFQIAPDLSSRQGDWEDYARTVASRLARDFPGDWLGLDLAIASDLPRAAGLSSSSALVVGLTLALGDRNRLWERPDYVKAIGSKVALAGYAGAVENGRPFGTFESGGGVGTLGGSEDQSAILCARYDRVSQYRFEPVVFEVDVGLPDDVVFAVAASGVVAAKTGDALGRYNAIARSTHDLWELVRGAAPLGARTLGEALIDHPELTDELRRRIDAEVPGEPERLRFHRRLEQLRAESVDLIPSAARAIGNEDWIILSEIVAKSQRMAEEALGNQVPETSSLVRLAIDRGAIAASAFGAGFGGSVWALVPREEAHAFLADWEKSYLGVFPRFSGSASFFLTRPASSANRDLII